VHEPRTSASGDSIPRLRRRLDALVGPCRLRWVSAVEHRPADTVAQLLVVKDEVSNRLWELLALPLALQPTGVFGLAGSDDEGYDARGFPWTVTLPGHRDLSMGRRWHFFFAWAFVINGLIYLIYSFASGHIRRDLAPTEAEIKHIGASISEHARFKFPKGEEAKRYNVLQKLTYLLVALVLLPLMLLTGLAMSPGMDAGYPILLDIFGGRQSARTIHFLAAGGIVLFVAVHLFMVLVSGVWNNLRSMITGKYVVEPAEETK